MSTAIAAPIFCLLALVVVSFQVALAAGAPWGALTWGGRFPGRLPPAMRLVAMLSAVLLSTFALIVTVRAGVFLRQWEPVSRTLIWVVVTYCALGLLANAATPSQWERRIWLPVILLMLVTSVVVATR